MVPEQELSLHRAEGVPSALGKARALHKSTSMDRAFRPNFVDVCRSMNNQTHVRKTYSLRYIGGNVTHELYSDSVISSCCRSAQRHGQQNRSQLPGIFQGIDRPGRFARSIGKPGKGNTHSQSCLHRPCCGFGGPEILVEVRARCSLCPGRLVDIGCLICTWRDVRYSHSEYVGPN